MGLILIVFMLQFTHIIDICVLSSVNASQELCIGTVVNMSTVRIVELLRLDKCKSL